MSSEWREHPKLRDRFLPDHPDDLQVLVHDGGPRISRNPAEAVWVTVIGMDGEVFRGRVLETANPSEGGDAKPWVLPGSFSGREGSPGRRNPRT